MLAAYLAATILGGTMLAASLFTGHHGGGHELDDDHDGDAHGSALVSFIISIRFWTYLLAFGGAAGLLLHKVAHLDEPLAFALSLAVGALSGISAQLIVRRLGSDSGGTVASRDMVFKLGTMLLPVAPGQASRVRLTINNQTVDLIATTDDPAIAARDEVVILDIKDGVAHVTRNQPAGEKS